MSHSKAALAEKEPRVEIEHQPEIIPWPDVRDYIPESEKKSPPRVRLSRNFLYYKGKRIPILQFQKAGYGKLLKLLVKEIES